MKGRKNYMTWLEIISYVAITIGVLQGILITVDVIRYPQKMMPIMNIVWPVTGLYFPIFGIWAYFRLGRDKEEMDMEMGDMSMNHDDKPFWQSVFVSTTHCSSGCSIGDLIGAPLVFILGWTIFGSTIFADYVTEFILAYVFGLLFQYYGMGFKKHDNPGQAIKSAIKADTFSLIAFEIGMFGWMAIANGLLFTMMPEPTTVVFWFMMQLAMMIGFCTSYPANWYLVKKGVKHAM